MNQKWLLFVVASILTWGAYVPTIGKGGAAFTGPVGSRSMKAFLFIGLAYFLMAVLIPGIRLCMAHDWTGFNGKAATISTIAGALGAFGALGIIFAIGAGGKPPVVASLVFAGAPIMSVFVSMVWDSNLVITPKPGFYIGLVLAALGAALVLYYRPIGGPHGASAAGPKAPQASPTTTH